MLLNETVGFFLVSLWFPTSLLTVCAIHIFSMLSCENDAMFIKPILASIIFLHNKFFGWFSFVHCLGNAT